MLLNQTIHVFNHVFNHIGVTTTRQGLCWMLELHHRPFHKVSKGRFTFLWLCKVHPGCISEMQKVQVRSPIACIVHHLLPLPPNTACCDTQGSPALYSQETEPTRQSHPHSIPINTTASKPYSVSVDDSSIRVKGFQPELTLLVIVNFMRQHG